MTACAQSSLAHTDIVRAKLRKSLNALLGDTEFLEACAKAPDRLERFLEDLQWGRQAVVCVAKER